MVGDRSDNHIKMKLQFGGDNPVLDSYEVKDWNLGGFDFIEFFSGVNVMVDGKPLALDLEWDSEIFFFQFCSSKDVLIVGHEKHEGDLRLKSFLENHMFFAKGASNDHKQLKLKFGRDFYNIEDMLETRLLLQLAKR